MTEYSEGRTRGQDILQTSDEGGISPLLSPVLGPPWKDTKRSVRQRGKICLGPKVLSFRAGEELSLLSMRSCKINLGEMTLSQTVGVISGIGVVLARSEIQMRNLG